MPAHDKPVLLRGQTTMARLPRYETPSQPQDITQRGNNRQPIFATNADYQFFGDALVEAAEKLPCRSMPMSG
jgi:REP element-mobilizing transposase RayT